MVTSPRRKQKQYSQSFKKSILKKVLTGDRTLASLCREYGFSPSTYYYWVKQEIERSGCQMKNSKSQEWTITEKLNAIKTTASMSGEEKAKWCRENGTYVHKIEQWKKT